MLWYFEHNANGGSIVVVHVALLFYKTKTQRFTISSYVPRVDNMYIMHSWTSLGHTLCLCICFIDCTIENSSSSSSIGEFIK